MELLQATVDLAAIAHNTQVLKSRAGKAELIAVVKANAYGHGVRECVPVMAANGADRFGVATIPEALEVRAALAASEVSVPVLCWVWDPHQPVDDALSQGVELGVSSLEHVRALAGQRVDVHLKIDTGLNRSGIDEEDLPAILRAIAAEPGLRVVGMFTHFACADTPDSPSMNEQARLLERAVARARSEGVNPRIVHAANSPAVFTRPDLRYDAIRPGLALYGISPLPDATSRDLGLRPALTWSSTVSVVKPIRRGEGVSYGLTWRAPDDGYTAVVAVGYADGLPRAVQTRTGRSGCFVTISGRRYRQVGRVCMDQIVIDLGANPQGVRAGDKAIIFGPGDDGEMSVDELAEAAGTINYEIVCAPKGRTRWTFLPVTPERS